ncbi:MAG TPA: hypothetical protein VEH04_09875, partial [Verrucomicrobiae bacterium]|nr:hypothetical protein [Verrucomicrobiae bacterium]
MDLERLTWGWNTAFGETKNERYKAALENFIRTYADFDISALAMERMARVLQQEGDLVAAHKVAERGAQVFPQSVGGKLCRNLLLELEAKAVQISTERVWNCFDRTGILRLSENAQGGGDRSNACPKITIRYRNVDQVYFRAIPYNWEVFLQKRHNRPENLSQQERSEVLATAFAHEWSEKLPPTSDYKEVTMPLAAPEQLKPGFYFIVASHDPSFGAQENQVSMAAVWVSDLSLVTRTRQGQIEGFVLD